MKDILDQVDKEMRKKRTKYVLSIAIIVIGVGAILFALEHQGSPKRIATQLSPRTGQPAQDHQISHSPQSAVPHVNAVLLGDSVRDNFISTIKAFEKEIEPQISSNDFKIWGESLQHQILTLKNESLTLFSASKYEAAREKIKSASEFATRALSEREKDYIRYISAAKKAIEADNFEVSLINIFGALKTKPASDEAIALKREIDALPQVLRLLHNAKVARSENNLEVEHNNLRKVLEISPGRSDVGLRLDIIKKAIDESQFSESIRIGFEGISKRDLSIARKALSGAQRIFADRKEISLLSSRISALEKEIGVEELLQSAKTAIAQDNWASALTFYKKAEIIAPKSQPILDGIVLSQSIISLDREISFHLNSPHRLSSSNIANDASKLIDRALQFARHSPALLSNTKKLEGALSLYTQVVPVKVTSDGKTIVSVKGIGIIGTITEKVIELRPGEYALEGIRVGYKTKLVRISIPPSGLNLLFEISCDEPL